MYFDLHFLSIFLYWNINPVKNDHGIKYCKYNTTMFMIYRY